MSGVVVRPYQAADAPATLEIFSRAITTTARSAYSAEQTAAWLGEPPSLPDWDRARASVRTFVAELGGRVVGFTDLDDQGYVDRLFVHPDTGRRGVASALVSRVVHEGRRRGLSVLTTHASLVAEPVLSRHGFEVVARETVHRGDVALDRFEMVRALRT
ncbi:GNAT family N-acetyltransferase [Aeromicrobium massiliense]|uniref:GNAT family N-acetyltransferase n=1 Tax=Aeromicrobium massiliense TaxID=1464554 RepID=UPI0002FCA2B0|nr:GNAT family N-acetyltransferase [Aeromicrobium massiliense]